MSMNSSNRRQFLSAAAGAGVALAADGPRPNILWLTSEDNGPHLGCYGDTYATTPNLDRLASRSLRYNTAWSNAPVCAPARTTLISGLYPPCTGAEHMRSMTRLPQAFKMYPQYLREAGYYCTNNSKTDYNLAEQGKVWDESSKDAHWRKRNGAQPFFAIFNFLISHESQIRKRPHQLVHDPSKVHIPAYHPDTPEVRHDWAQYYDNLTTMDGEAGAMMRQLEQDGLADDTIIFYYGDHGSGMPRSKRWPYNSGLQVPLLMHIPEKFRHLAPPGYKAGGTTDRLVGFIDMAPTLMSLVGMKPAAHLQGHAFAGSHTAPEQPYLYGFRGRMDERYDMVRSVRDQRYVYIRNYMPHKIYGQHIDYMFETPTTQVWKKLYDAGKLNQAQSHFWETKPPEELYDLQNDRDEVNNLAADPAHRQRLERMRKAQQELAAKIRDVGFLPEAEIHSRSQGSTPYEMGHDEKRYPAARVMAAAERASMLKQDALPDLLKAMEDADSAVRYWGALGVLMRGAPAMEQARAALRKALADAAPSVRIIASEALGRYGNAEDLQLALPVLSELAAPDKNGVYISMLAMNAIDILDKKALPLKGMIEKMPRRDPKANNRLSTYVDRLVEKTLGDLSF